MDINRKIEILTHCQKIGRNKEYFKVQNVTSDELETLVAEGLVTVKKTPNYVPDGGPDFHMVYKITANGKTLLD